MKVVAFNGSPRKDGNTGRLLETVLSVLREQGVETKMVQLGGRSIHGCTACMKCFEKKDGRCVIEGDVINDCIQAMCEADGMLIGSPTYFANVSTEIKALIDRAGMVAIANGRHLRRKAGAGVVAVRRAGAATTFDAINKFFFINEMIVPGSIYWNLGIGRLPGEVMEDEEGLNTMRTLGEHMAWLLKKINQD